MKVCLKIVCPQHVERVMRSKMKMCPNKFIMGVLAQAKSGDEQF
jgi:hypothetical protein